MYKYFLLIFFPIALIAQTETAPSSGDGSSGDPYQIDTLNNLYWITQNSGEWDAYYIQTANIDASSSSSWDGGAGFTPIGNSGTKFTGSYDGDGYTIDSLFINRSISSIGMFGYIGVDSNSTTTIQNLGLINVSITGQHNVGALVGNKQDGNLTVSNCYISGSVTGTNNVGGLVGYINMESAVSNCYSTCSVTGSGDIVGGLAGYLRNQSNVVNSYSTGSVNGNNFVGGLVGFLNNSSVSNSFWDTQTSGTSIGIGAGNSTGATGKTTAEMKTASTFTNAGWDFELETTNGTDDYWDMDNVNSAYNSGYPFLSWENGDTVLFNLPPQATFSPANNANDVARDTDITITFTEAILNADASDITDTNVDGLITLKDTDASGTDIAFDATINAGKTVITINPTSYLNYEQTVYVAIDSGQVEDADGIELEELVSATFTTVEVISTMPSGMGTENDPYLVGTLNNLYWMTENSGEWDKYYIQTSNIDASSTSAWDDGQGFTPLGNNSTKFTGTYDGGGYVINDLNINRPSTTYIGLFGYTIGSTIKDLGVINVNITGGHRTGGLVGYNNSSAISNCYSTGSIIGGQFVGGLIGMVDDSSTVNNCYSSGSVTGSGTDAGGLVGYNNSSAISNCYSTGSVVSSEGIRIGGLVGWSLGGSISNCYSTGSVTGSNFVGGIIGFGSGGYAVSGLFWNIDDFSIDNGIGTGITTIEMMDAYTFCFAGWDFEEDENGNDNGTTGGISGNGTDNWWDMVQDGNHYPVLSWQNGDTVFVTDLTNECLTDNGGCGDPTYNICTNNIGAPPTCFDIVANGVDLIVDQSAVSQYMADDYLRFDVFEYQAEIPSTGPYSNLTRRRPLPNMKLYGTEWAVEFNERLDLSDNAPILGDQFSQEVWVYVDNTVSSPPDRTIFSAPTITLRSASSLGNIYEIIYGFYSGSSHFETSVTVNIPVRTWFHMATTFDGTNYKLFINGQEINNYTGAAGNIPDGTPVRYIGENFLGGIDELRIWDIARSQEQIYATMDESLTGDETGLVAYYPMDLNNNWEIVDYSPNNNHVPISQIVPNQPDVATRYSSDSCPSPNGTSDCPYPTIRGALDHAQPADRVYIREGRYSEYLNEYQFNPSHLEWLEVADLAPKITIEGYPNEDVRLDGTVPISADWEYHENGIYKAVLDMNAISHLIKIPVDSIYGVFVNDRYMIPAMPINFKNPTDPTTGNPIAPEPGTVWEKRLPSPTFGDYFPGEYANLDTVEEWSFDANTSTLYLIPGENFPTSTNVRVRVRDRFLHFFSSDNIELKNIHFFAGSIRASEVSYLTIEDCRFSFSGNMGLSSNVAEGGSYTTVRNCIFEYTNDNIPWLADRVMYPTVENVLFRYNDWFQGNLGGGVTAASASSNNFYNVMGASVWRYVTVENVFSGGINPGMNSLTEYCRFENLYESMDGAGIQRNPISVVGSTSRYLWIFNLPGINGMRFDGSLSGNNGDVHHVVTAGNSRGMKLKGDYHDVYHVTAFDNSQKGDIALPWNKYAGTTFGNDEGETFFDDIFQNGNAHTNFHNTIAEYNLSCASPDCWPSAEDLESWYTYGDSTGFDGEHFPSLPSHPFHLDSMGIWYGLPLDRARPQFEMMDPWTYFRQQDPDSVIAEWGEDPWEDHRQSYDFRPRKGSSLIDNGVIIEGINDGQDITLNHPPMFPGQNRHFVGTAPDQGAYEYGDLVYWIPGYRYPHPSVPIPNNNAVDVPIDYSLVWNYPYKKNYSGTMAIVTLTGPGISRTETFIYPYNVFFETFQPGGTYTWSVSVDGISGGNWSFTVADKIYPLNDRSLDTTAVDSVLIPLQPQTLEVLQDNLSFLRFDIPITFYNNRTIHLNLIPENVSLSEGGGIILYKFNYPEWGEGIDEYNIGIADHSLLTPLDTLYSLEPESPVSVDLSAFIDTHGDHSFALGVLDSTDVVSFYSKEKLVATSGGARTFVPKSSLWPNISFQPGDVVELADIDSLTTYEDLSRIVYLSATDGAGDSLTYTASSADTNVTVVISGYTLTLTPAADWNGSAVITGVTYDSTNQTDSEFTFTVHAVNDAPEVSTPLVDIAIDEDDFGVILIPRLEDYFSDMDEGDVLTFTAQALGEGLDSLSFTASGSFAAIGRMANYNGTKVMTVKRSKLKQQSNKDIFDKQLVNKDSDNILTRHNNPTYNDSLSQLNILESEKDLFYKRFYEIDSRISDSRKNRFFSNDASQRQVVESEKDLYNKRFVKADNAFTDIYQNSSTIRTDSTALIVYPTENFIGEINIRVTATDTSGGSVDDIIAINIENFNDAPFVADAHNDILVYLGSEPVLLYQQPNLSYWTGYQGYMQYAYSPDNLGVFDDSDILAGDILTITAQPLDETLVTLEYNSGGIYESASLTLFVENGPGETDIVMTATDIAGLSVSDTVHVTVASVPGGIFGLPKTISNVSLALSVYATDLDGDDDVDVLGTGYHTDGFLWWENDGSQVFTEHNLEGDAEHVNSVYAADLDGDGDMDILEAGQKIAWFENDGNQGFTNYIIVSDTNDAISVYASDVDSDGDMDILGAGNNIAWFENDGTQNFTEHTIITWFDCQYSNTCGGARDVYAADVDGDGDVDILGATYNTQVPYNNYKIIWWKNDGSQSFTEHIIDDDFSGASSVYATDVDGDGNVDILGAARGADEICWWKNDGEENFTKHTIDDNFDGAYDVYATDLDGDGDVDILGAAQNADDIVWWENEGSQGFTRNNITMPYYQLDGARSVYATDVDGDGDMDVLGAAGDYGIDGTKNGSITWWENNGNNPPAVTTALPDVTIDEDTFSAIIIPVLEEYFTDTDEEDILSYTASALGVGLDSLSINTGLTVFPTENFAGYINIMIIASDIYGESVADTMMLTIENINDAPVLTAALPDVTIDEDDFGAVIIPSLEEYFGDVDVGDVLIFTGDALGEGLDSLVIGTLNLSSKTLSLTSVSRYGGREIITLKRSHIKAVMSAESDAGRVIKTDRTKRGKSTVKSALVIPSLEVGSANMTTTRFGSRSDSTALVVYPTENFVGDIEIMVVASDTSGEFAADTMMLTIENINDAPILANYPDISIMEDDTLTVMFSATDVDGDSLSFGVAGPVDNPDITVSNFGSGFHAYASPNWHGDAEIRINVWDGALADTSYFILTIVPVNDTPVLTAALPDVTIDEDDFGAVIIPAMEVHFNDVDEGDILSYTGNALGEGLDSLSFSTDDNFSAMGRMVNYHGIKIMTIKRSELKKSSTGKVFTPQRTDKDKSGQQGIMSVNVDSDLIDTRKNLSLSRSDSTALIVYPTENFVGDVEIMVVASDTSGEFAADTMMLTIENINDAPFVSNSMDDMEVDEDSEPITLDINGVFDDADILVGDSLTITAQSLADTLVTVDYDSNSVPVLLFVENGHGETDIVVTATDIAGLSIDDTVHVIVVSVNDAPGDFTLLSPEHDATITITPDNISDTLWFEWTASIDIDGDSLIYEFDASTDLAFIEGLLQLEGGTTAWVEYSVLAEAVDAVDTVSGDWSLFVTDGADTVDAVNGAFTVTIDAVAMSVDLKELIPDEFALYQNYPNPFNPVTLIKYDLPEQSHVYIIIYDMLGRQVRTMVNQSEEAGFKTVIWNATNDYGKPVSAGVYLYQIKAGDFRQTRKMVLLK